MKPEQMTQSLESVASQLGVRVRYETMTGESMGAGGLCKIRGDWAIIIDRRATPSDRVAILVDALAGFDTAELTMPKDIAEALAGRRARVVPPPRSAREESDGRASPGAPDSEEKSVTEDLPHVVPAA